MDIHSVVDRVVAGEILSLDEARSLFLDAPLDDLLRAADKVRQIRCGDSFDLCTIHNAKSGRCSQDCSYCAQSVHYNTEVQVYGLIEPEEALRHALFNEKNGAHRFSLVTSGRGLKPAELDSVVETYRLLQERSGISLCASLGILSVEALRRLREVGVVTYHHNLETGPRHFHKVCTTHTYQDRVDTIRAAQEAGMVVCSGGIIGLGETVEDRIEMFLDLRKLGVVSVPINALMAIPGTPLENEKPLSPEEILRSCAIVRLILPEAMIRLGGGRSLLGKEVQRALRGGINALLTGDYLTTSGSNTASDIEMVKGAGYSLPERK